MSTAYTSQLLPELLSSKSFTDQVLVTGAKAMYRELPQITRPHCGFRSTCIDNYILRVPVSAAKAKYKELLQIKANLEADNQELQQKYGLKAQ